MKKVISIGVEIPGGYSEFLSHDSSGSLLDADIIIFEPDSFFFPLSRKTYNGKPSLSEEDSFKAKEQMMHWRTEILEAYNAGKTVFIILDEFKEVFVDSGKRNYSGTGRNRQKTILVELLANYDVVPLEIKLRNSKGSSMILTDKDQVLTKYWEDFYQDSQYKVLIEGLKRPLIKTKSGGKTVGAVLKSNSHKGAIVFIPFLDLRKDEFEYEQENDEGETEIFWTKKGQSFGSKFNKRIVEIDKLLKQESLSTVIPDWAKASSLQTPKQTNINEQLLEIESKIEKLQEKKQKLKGDYTNEGLLLGLLFENGRPLEKAILLALRLFGFEASQYQDDSSEFDSIFKSKEGRFLGEAEGKDSKQIQIGKMRQLITNIMEDFEKEDVDKIARGVLFGNAFRLKPLAERGDFFSDKCIEMAKSKTIALVKTPDLFFAARYLSNQEDKAFAKKCRTVILKAEGSIVVFPSVPKKGQEKLRISKK